jgi:hypothetical protein
LFENFPAGVETGANVLYVFSGGVTEPFFLVNLQN